jgi:hypothetical protein
MQKNYSGWKTNVTLNQFLESLKDKRRYQEAAEVALDYAKVSEL